jgi:hypothetical protein
MYRCFRPDARANLPSIVITAHSLHLHIGGEPGLLRMMQLCHQATVGPNLRMSTYELFADTRHPHIGGV